MSAVIDAGLAPEAVSSRAEKGGDTTSRLWTWLLEQGVTVPAMEVATMNGVRGLRATRPVKSGSLVMHVPRKLVITQDVARGSWTGKVITAIAGSATDHVYLAAFLLEVKRDGGLWKPYVDALPQRFPDIPLYFSPEELDLLQGSPLLRMISQRREWMKRDYENMIVRCFPPVLRFSFEQFMWARCCAASRAFGLRDRDGKSASGLVPGGDMFNHVTKPNCRYTGDIGNGFTTTASEDIAAGAQALESYGSRSNAAMLTVYGICLEANPDDEAQIDLPALPSDHCLADRAKDFGHQQGNVREFAVPADFNAAGIAPLFSFLRLCCADPSSVPNGMVVAGKPTTIRPISRDVEVAALELLAGACRKSLDRYRTSVEQDDELLAEGRLSSRQRNAVIVRRGEKVVLKRYLALTQEAIPLLADKRSDLAAYKNADHAMTGYFAQLAQQLGQTGSSLQT